MFLNPSFKNLKAMEKALRIFWKHSPDVEQKIQNVRYEIEQLIAKLYLEYCGEETLSNEFEKSEWGSSCGDGSIDSWSEFSGKRSGAVGETAEPLIIYELSSYKVCDAPLLSKNYTDYACCDVLDFWKKSDYTFLREIAKVMCAAMPRRSGFN